MLPEAAGSIGRVDSVEEIIAGTDWSVLRDAYGPASDAPCQLMAMLDGAVKARSGAVRYLDVAVLHQGSVSTATGPVARAVAAMLGDRRALEIVEDVLPWDPEPRALRVALAAFLALFAEACRFERTDADLQRESYAACYALITCR